MVWRQVCIEFDGMQVCTEIAPPGNWTAKSYYLFVEPAVAGIRECSRLGVVHRSASERREATTSWLLKRRRARGRTCGSVVEHEAMSLEMVFGEVRA